MPEDDKGKGTTGSGGGLDPEDRRSLLKAGAFFVGAIAVIILIKVFMGW